MFLSLYNDLEILICIYMVRESILTSVSGLLSGAETRHMNIIERYSTGRTLIVLRTFPFRKYPAITSAPGCG